MTPPPADGKRCGFDPSLSEEVAIEWLKEATGHRDSLHYWNGKEKDEHGCVDCVCGEHAHSYSEMADHVATGLSSMERLRPDLAALLKPPLTGDSSQSSAGNAVGPPSEPEVGKEPAGSEPSTVPSAEDKPPAEPEGCAACEADPTLYLDKYSPNPMPGNGHENHHALIRRLEGERDEARDLARDVPRLVTEIQAERERSGRLEKIAVEFDQLLAGISLEYTADSLLAGSLHIELEAELKAREEGGK